MEDMQPGQVILPNPPNGGSQPPVGAPEPERPQEGGKTTPTPTEGGDTVGHMPAQQIVDEAPLYHASTAASQQPEWQYTQGSSAPASETSAIQDLAWTAAEFIAHPKGVEWYMGLTGASCILTIVVYFLTSDVFSAAVVIFMAVLFGVYAARQPRMQQYGLDRQGLHVGPKTYSFHEFKAFSVSEENSIASVVFMPLKRFMPPLTIYVSMDAEETVVSVLSQYLPFEPHKADALDALLRRIRF